MNGILATPAVVERSWLRGLTRLDAILLAILFGPFTVLQIAGRTPSIYWVDVVIGILAFVSFAKLCARPGESSFRVPRVILWAFAYTLIAATSLLLTEDPLASIATLKLRIMPIGVFFLARRYGRSLPAIDGFFRSVIAFGCALSAIALYNWYGFSSGAQLLGEELGPKDMLQLSFGRSNYLASILVLIIPTAIAFIRRRKRRPLGLAYLSALVLISIALIFTQSRGALISLAFGFMAWGFFGLASAFSVRMVVSMLFAIIATLMAGLFLWSKIPEEVRIGLATAFGLLWSDARLGNYGGGRTELWLAAINGAWQSNLLGIGLGNQRAWYAGAGLTPSAHNLYLETLLETGLIGLIALLGILHGFGATIWRIWKNRSRRERPLAGALLATFVIALVNAAQEPSFWGPQYSCLFWLMMGVAYSWQNVQTIRELPLSAGRN